MHASIPTRADPQAAPPRRRSALQAGCKRSGVARLRRPHSPASPAGAWLLSSCPSWGSAWLRPGLQRMRALVQARSTGMGGGVRRPSQHRRQHGGHAAPQRLQTQGNRNARKSTAVTTLAAASGCCEAVCRGCRRSAPRKTGAAAVVPALRPGCPRAGPAPRAQPTQSRLRRVTLCAHFMPSPAPCPKSPAHAYSPHGWGV